MIISAIQDKKGENICSIDLRKINDAVCNFFIICDAESTTQVRAIAGNVEEQMLKKQTEKPWHIEGMENQEWVLLDYVDVVIHIFQDELRRYYDMESMWYEAKRVL